MDNTKRKNPKTLRISGDVYDRLTQYWEADPHYSWNKLLSKLIDFAQKGGIVTTATVGQPVPDDQDDEESGVTTTNGNNQVS